MDDDTCGENDIDIKVPRFCLEKDANGPVLRYLRSAKLKTSCFQHIIHKQCGCIFEDDLIEILKVR